MVGTSASLVFSASTPCPGLMLLPCKAITFILESLVGNQEIKEKDKEIKAVPFSAVALSSLGV